MFGMWRKTRSSRSGALQEVSPGVHAGMETGSRVREQRRAREIEAGIMRFRYITCHPCCTEGREGTRAKLIDGGIPTCRGCYMKRHPGLCGAGCNRPIHKGACLAIHKRVSPVRAA